MTATETTFNFPHSILSAHRQRFRRLLPAIGLLLLGLLAWEAVVIIFRIEGFLLPKPSVIGATFQDQFLVVLPAGLFTMREAVGGFAIGSVLGIGIALATARWTLISEGVMPFAIAVNSTPIIALAPIMNNWFGITNPFSKMSIVALIVFFPIMINTVRGLRLSSCRTSCTHSSAARRATCHGIKIGRASCRERV